MDHDSSLPLERTIPPAIVATPAAINLAAGDEPTWWRPGWHDVKQFVGWRWILLIPAVFCILLIVAGWLFPAFAALTVALGIKLGLILFAFSFSLVGYVTRKALKAGTEPFCIFCGYNLTGLPDDYRCPECGRPYTHAVIEEYRKDPHWFIERWKQSFQTPASVDPFESGPLPRRNRADDGTE